jgi:2-iminobutanoate/2-iminopropanoate deaminase
MKLIETTKAPLPGGHYSQATISNGLVFVSGQLPLVPGALRVIPDGIEAQTRQALRNLQAILASCGAALSNVMSVQIFISDIALWSHVDSIYSEIMGSHKPARTVIPCGELHYGAIVEISAVAYIAQAATHDSAH